MKQLKTIALILLISFAASCQSSKKQKEGFFPAAYQIDQYIPLLEGKSVALVVNPTSEIAGVHLADTLVSLGINIKAAFAPEHGFRGEADAGQKIEDGVDQKTGIPII